MAYPRIRIIDVVRYLLVVGVALRGLRDYADSGKQGIVAVLLLVFFLVSILGSWFRRRFNWYPHLYFAFQTGLILFLSLLSPYVDYFVILYIFLSIEAMMLLPQRVAYMWIGIFCLTMAGALVYDFDWSYALPMIVIYVSASLFFASYAAVTRRAEEAREESLALLTRLQTAHRELQAYAAQIEELAAAEQRNRLARELHDSVTQTIFSMTLTAESTRILLERDPSKVAPQLDRLQELAQSALAEMRFLINQLRPKTVAEEGLVSALRQHVVDRKSRDGLSVVLRVDEERRLPPEIEEALFRVAQEALNNVVKHAQTDQAEVTLDMRGEVVSLLVEDRGLGFDPSTTFARPSGSGTGRAAFDAMDSGASHLGLISMRERVTALGGTLEIESQPQGGTRIKVKVPLAKEGE
ncbi:MAG: sensor histidine kinase [Anaerolineales bacterium]|nr:MAG: sensor histidine kinase [Anaerolineales bacterium]